MKEWILYTSSLMVCISLQSVWSTALWVPPVWMIVLFFVATRKAFLQSLMFSYVAGFFWCVFTGLNIGLACTITLILSSIIGAAKHWLDFTPSLNFIYVCAVLGVLWQVLHIVLSQILEPVSLHPAYGFSFISCVLMTLSAWPMLYLLSRIAQNKEPDWLQAVS